MRRRKKKRSIGTTVVCQTVVTWSRSIHVEPRSPVGQVKMTVRTEGSEAPASCHGRGRMSAPISFLQISSLVLIARRLWRKEGWSTCDGVHDHAKDEPDNRYRGRIDGNLGD